MSQEKNSKQQQQLAIATNSNNDTVDSISTDIGKVGLSNNGGDSSSSDNTSGGGGGGSEEVKSSSKERDTSCAQNLQKMESDEIISDDKLFKDPPPKEDCSICMLPMPYPYDHSPHSGAQPMYQSCCGKTVCLGCMLATAEEVKKGNIKKWCPYCRIPMYLSRKEYLEGLENRTNLNDAEAFHELGLYYTQGDMGIPQDMNKGFQLLNRAAELGSTNAHDPIAVAYLSQYGSGQGVQNLDKAIHHYKLAAIGGHEGARHNLGTFACKAGNMDRSMKHFMIAARAGYDSSLKEVGIGFRAGHVTKDEYANTLRAYQVSVDEMKSVQRAEAEILTAALNNKVR